MNYSLETLTKKLINQPSINTNYRSCQNCHNLIINFLEKLNFHVEPMCFNKTYNIWAYHQQSKKKHNHTLLFLGHTDVVNPGNLKNWRYPPFSGTIHNNILYGRGAADMKGSLAAMLIATKNFIKKYPNHQERLAFIITSDEEGTGINGTMKVTKILTERNEKINYCIIGEPSSSLQLGDVIKNGRRGSLTGTLIIQGMQQHVAYSPQLSKNNNIIHLVILAFSELLTKKWDQKNSILFPETTMQITNIHTNKNWENNITPNQITLNFNFRFNDQSSINSIKKNIEKILLFYNIKDYKIHWTISAQPYFSNPGKLANIVTDIIKKSQKITPKLETTGGTSDGRFISAMDQKTEIIELGVLNKTIHQENECVHFTDLEKLSNIYQKIIEKVLLYTQ